MDKHLSNLFQCLPCSLSLSFSQLTFLNFAPNVWDILAAISHGLTFLPWVQSTDFSLSLYNFCAWGFSFIFSQSSSLFKLHNSTFFQFFLTEQVSDLWSFSLPSFRHPPMGPHWKAMPKLGSKHHLKSHQCWLEGKTISRGLDSCSLTYFLQ